MKFLGIGFAVQLRNGTAVPLIKEWNGTAVPLIKEWNGTAVPNCFGADGTGTGTV